MSVQSAYQAARRPHTSPSGEGGQRRILLVGQSRTLKQIRTTLKKLKVKVESTPWIVGLLDTLDRSTVGLVLVPPLAGIRPWRAVRVIRESEWGSTGGILVVFPEELSDRSVRTIYNAGATAVFEWHRDALLFPDLVAGTLGVEQVRGPATDSDQALARMVRTRIRLASSIPKGLRVSCSDGVVRLSGDVDGIWRRELVGEYVERVPGVRRVVTRNLRIPASGRSDREILRAVKGALRALASPAGDTISAQVDSGFVTLAGNVNNRRELEEVVRAISNVDGARGLENYIAVAPHQQDRDSFVARRLRGALARLFPGEEVSMKVFGGVVVLQGRVPDLRTKRRIESIITDDDNVIRIINKMVVR